jgi:hypothetical protein
MHELTTVVSSRGGNDSLKKLDLSTIQSRAHPGRSLPTRDDDSDPGIARPLGVAFALV